MIIITVNQRRIQYDLTTKTARTRGNYNNTHWDFLQKFHLYYFTNPRIQKPCSKIRGFLIGWSKDHNFYFYFDYGSNNFEEEIMIFEKKIKK